MLAENTSLGIGLLLSTVCTGVLFVGVLALWRSQREPLTPVATLE